MKKVVLYFILFCATPWASAYPISKISEIFTLSIRRNLYDFPVYIAIELAASLCLAAGILFMLWLEKRFQEISEKGCLICMVGSLTIPLIFLILYFASDFATARPVFIRFLILSIFSSQQVLFSLGVFFLFFFFRSIYGLVKIKKNR